MLAATTMMQVACTTMAALSFPSTTHTSTDNSSAYAPFASSRAREPPITLDDLLRGGTPPAAGPVDDAWLGPGPGALPASNALHGALVLLNTENIALNVVRDDFDYARFPTRRRLPPGLRVELTTDTNGHVIPVKTGLQITGDIVWNLFFTTGITWDEPENTDGGWSRALVPFALSERNANCIHNGLMLFAFWGRDAIPAISGVRFQITQETCLYYKVDYWGQLMATFEGISSGQPPLLEARARHARELQARLPTKPIEQLAVDFPGFEPDVFGRGLTPIHVSSLGVTVAAPAGQGAPVLTHYVRDCVTRTGDYAGLCDEMILPSYSLAKSIVGGLGLMRLAHLLGGADPSASNPLPLSFRDNHFFLPQLACTGNWCAHGCLWRARERRASGTM